MEIGKIYLVQHGEFAGMRGELVDVNKKTFTIVATNGCHCYSDCYGCGLCDEGHGGDCWDKGDEIEVSLKYTPERYKEYLKKEAERKKKKEKSKTYNKIQGTILTLKGLALKHKDFSSDISKEVEKVLAEL